MLNKLYYLYASIKKSNKINKFIKFLNYPNYLNINFLYFEQFVQSNKYLIINIMQYLVALIENAIIRQCSIKKHN